MSKRNKIKKPKKSMKDSKGKSKYALKVDSGKQMYGIQRRTKSRKFIEREI